MVDKVQIDPLLLLDREMVGAVLYGNMTGKANYQMALDILKDHGKAARSLVTHRYGLQDIQEAFATAMDKSKQSIKVHLKIN
jgi:threonine dehydrogenase-like Zn-dependent dehydrogenase